MQAKHEAVQRQRASAAPPPKPEPRRRPATAAVTAEQMADERLASKEFPEVSAPMARLRRRMLVKYYAARGYRPGEEPPPRNEIRRKTGAR